MRPGLPYLQGGEKFTSFFKNSYRRYLGRRWKLDLRVHALGLRLHDEALLLKLGLHKYHSEVLHSVIRRSCEDKNTKVIGHAGKKKMMVMLPRCALARHGQMAGLRKCDGSAYFLLSSKKGCPSSCGLQSSLKLLRLRSQSFHHNNHTFRPGWRLALFEQSR